MSIEVNNNTPGNFAHVTQAVEFIQSKIGDLTPEIGVVCGSGLGIIGDNIENSVKLDYNDIPHFQKTGTGVKGHMGELVIGALAGKVVVVMKGRFHPYEGYEPWKVAFPIRVMKVLGCRGVIITNAAGGLNAGFEVGDFMAIEDHLYLPGMAGFNPLVGPNDNQFGTRFPPMGDAYSKEWRQKLYQAAKSLNETKLQKGVYCCVFGPNFETPAEARYLRIIGGDAVGMSSVHEVVAARHCDMSVLAVSMITNKVVCSIDESVQADHSEVLETSENRGNDFVKLIEATLRLL